MSIFGQSKPSSGGLFINIAGGVSKQLQQDLANLFALFRQGALDSKKLSTTNPTAGLEKAVNKIISLNRQILNVQKQTLASIQQSTQAVGQYAAATSKAQAQTASTVNTVGAATQKTSQHMNTLGDATQRVIQRMKSFAAFTVAAGGILLLRNALRGTVTAIIEFDQSLKDIQAITNATDRQIQLMSVSIKKIAATTKYSTTEVADGMKTLGQAGLTTNEILQATEHVAHLATGTLTDFKDAAGIVTSTVRAFGLSFSDTQRVVDVFANAINRSKLNLDMLKIAMGYVAPVANAAGVSFEETTAAIMHLANAGLRASTIGTSLRRTFMHMQAPNKEFAAAIRATGMTLDDVNPRIVGLATAIDNVALVTPSAVEAIRFFGLRSSAAIAVLTQQGGAGLIRFQTLLNEVGAAARMFGVQTEGLAVKFKQVSDRMKLLAVNMGEAGFAGVLHLIADLIRPILSGLISLSETIGGKLLFAVTTTTLAFGALGLAIKAIKTTTYGGAFFNLLTINALKNGIDKLRVAFIGYATTLGATSGITAKLTLVTSGLFTLIKAHPFLWLMGAIAAVTTAYSHFKDSVEDTIQTLKESAEAAQEQADGIEDFRKQIEEAHKKGQGYNHILERMIQQYPELASVVLNARDSFDDLNEALLSAAMAKNEEALRSLIAAYTELDTKITKLDFQKRASEGMLAEDRELGVGAATQKQLDEVNQKLEQARIQQEAILYNALNVAKRFGIEFGDSIDTIRDVLIRSGAVSSEHLDEWVELIYNALNKLENVVVVKRQTIPPEIRKFFDELSDAQKDSMYAVVRDWNKNVSKELITITNTYEEGAEATAAVMRMMGEQAEVLRTELLKIGIDIPDLVARFTQPIDVTNYQEFVTNLSLISDQVDAEGKVLIGKAAGLNVELNKAIASGDALRMVAVISAIQGAQKAVAEFEEEVAASGQAMEPLNMELAKAQIYADAFAKVTKDSTATTKDYTAELKKQEAAQHALAVSLAEMRGETRKVFDLKLAKEIADVIEQFKTAKMDGVEPFVKELKEIREREYLAKLNKELQASTLEFHKLMGNAAEVKAIELDKEFDKWAVSAYLAAMSGHEYAYVLEEIRQKLENMEAAKAAEAALKEFHKTLEEINKEAFKLSSEFLDMEKFKAGMPRIFLDDVEELRQKLEASGESGAKLWSILNSFEEVKGFEATQKLLKQNKYYFDELTHTAEKYIIQTQIAWEQERGNLEAVDRLKELLLQKEKDRIDQIKKLNQDYLNDQIANASSWSEYWRLSLAKDLGALETTLDRKRAAWAKYYDIVKTFVSSIESSTKSLAQDSLYWAVWESDQKKKIIEKDYKDAISRMEEEKQKEITNAHETIENQEELAKKLEEIDKAYDEKRRTIEDEYYDKKKEYGEQFKNYWKSFLDSLVRSFTDMVAQLLVEWAKIAVLEIFIKPIIGSIGQSVGGSIGNALVGWATGKGAEAVEDKATDSESSMGILGLGGKVLGYAAYKLGFEELAEKLGYTAKVVEKMGEVTGAAAESAKNLGSSMNTTREMHQALNDPNYSGAGWNQSGLSSLQIGASALGGFASMLLAKDGDQAGAGAATAMFSLASGPLGAAFGTFIAFAEMMQRHIPTGGAIGTLGAGLQGYGEFEHYEHEIMARWSGMLEQMSHVTTDLSDTLVNIYRHGSFEAISVLDQMGNEMTTMQAGAMENFAAGGQAISDKFAVMGMVIGENMKALPEEAREALGTLRMTWNEYWSDNEAVTQEAYHRLTEEQAAHLAEFTGQWVQAYGILNEEVNNAIANFTGSADNLAAFGEEMMAFNDTISSEFISAINIAGADTDRLAQAISNYAEETGLSTTAVAELAAQHVQAEMATLGLINATASHSMITAEGSGFLAEHAQRLLDMQDALALTTTRSEDAESSVDMLSRTLRDMARDAGQATGAISSAVGALRSASSLSSISARASGGPVSRGNMYLVGEEGPEIVKMDGAGYVHNATETARMLGLRGMAGGGRFGDNPYIPGFENWLGTSGTVDTKHLRYWEQMAKATEDAAFAARVLTEMREAEINEMEESEKVLQRLVNSLEDEAKARKEIIDLAESQFDFWKKEMSIQKQWAEMIGDTKLALDIEYQEHLLDLAALQDAYGDASKPLQDLLWQMWGLKQAAKELTDQSKDLQKQQTNLNKMIQNHNVIQSLIDSIMGGGHAPVQSAEWFELRYQELLTAAKNDPDRISDFTSFASQYLDFFQGFGGSKNATGDVLKDLYDLQNSATEGKSLADLYYELNRINAQLEFISNQGGGSLVDQITAGTGKTSSEVLFDNWRTNVPGAQEYHDWIQTPGAKEHEALSNKVTKLYRDMFGISPDSQGLQYWIGQAATLSWDELIKHFRYAGQLDGRTAKFERGGFASPGWAMVGEQGPELVRFNQPAQVFNNTDTRSMMGGGDTIVKVYVGNKELKDITVDVIRTDRETQRQIKRVAHV